MTVEQIEFLETQLGPKLSLEQKFQNFHGKIFTTYVSVIEIKQKALKRRL